VYLVPNPVPLVNGYTLIEAAQERLVPAKGIATSFAEKLILVGISLLVGKLPALE
jgi:hypothetical protein